MFNKVKCVFQDLFNKTVAEGVKLQALYCLKAVKGTQRCKLDGNKSSLAKSVCNTVFKDSCNIQNNTTDSIVNNGQKEQVSESVNQESFQLLHSRLGHASLSKMKFIQGCKLPNKQIFDCGVRKNAKISNNRASSIFDLIHIDLWGPYRVIAINGARFFLTIVDDCSRVTWTFLLNNKLQVPKTVANF